MSKNVLTEKFFLPTKTSDSVHSPPNFSQALGDETDFSKPDTIRVIEKFLVDCSEAVSKRYTRYGALEKRLSCFRAYLIQWSLHFYICSLKQRYQYETEISSVSPPSESRTNMKALRKG